MRFRHRALLGILFVLGFSLLSVRTDLRGQTSQIDEAHSSLVQAFVQVQQADLDGAPADQIASLATNLNQALIFEANATQLYPKDISRSDYYATKSASLSNETSIAAQTLSTNAQRQSFFNQMGSYAVAVAAGLGSALFVLELPRLDRIVRRIRLRRTRFE